MSLTLQPPRKRDRFRGILGKTRSRSANTKTQNTRTQSTVTPARTQSQRPVDTRVHSSILADALEELGSDDRDTIRSILPKDAVDISAAFEGAHDCAKQLQQQCANDRWSWEYRGRQIYFSEQMEKILQFLDRFKCVIDVASNAEPVQIGLPWAGIRAILEVALNERHQRTALITGMELSLYMSNRLSVYLDVYGKLSPSPATRNFRTALVKLYAHIFCFLAHAIRIQRQRGIGRAVRALWDPHKLTQFEEECDKLCLRISEEARVCDSQTNLEAHLRNLYEIHCLSTSVLKMQEKFDLSKLQIAGEAMYNSSTEGGLSRCLPNTRTDLLEQINSWAADPTGKRIFWLCGKAGTGKSTISRTVAQELDGKRLLGASFFFKRGRAERSHAKLLFPTIARQLADLLPEITPGIAASLDKDSLLCDKYLTLQFEQLLLQPLQSVAPASLLSAGIVLVIDALDECSDSGNVKAILCLLSRLGESHSLRLRIFVTSRPELPVELGFTDMSGELHHDIRLEEAQKPSIAHDIRLFYEDQFATIRRDSLHQDDDLSVDWPGEQNICTLVDQAMPLFIFAFTVSRYISFSPKQNLAMMLRQRKDTSFSGLKGTYLPILQQIVDSIDEGLQETYILQFKRVVGFIVLAYNPLSSSALTDLLGVPAGVVGRVLSPLHSVLNIPRAVDDKTHRMLPITLFHLSFRDFLIDPNRNSESMFWIDPQERHSALGNHCIGLLESGVLRGNLCGVVDSGVQRAQVTRSVVDASLPEAVAYACSYWAQHVMDSGESINDDSPVRRFLDKHFLHWVEAMSWLGKASEIVPTLDALQTVTDANQGQHLLNLLEDMSRFALRNCSIVDEVPMQTYMSCLLFAPANSITRHLFGHSLQTYFDLMPRVPDGWGTERQNLEGHKDNVTAVAFSPDGRIVASGSADNTIRLWDTATGKERQKLEGHDNAVSSVAFSSDGTSVVSGSRDRSVRLWDITTGEEKKMFAGHTESVNTVAFSPNNRTVVSGSDDGTLRLWDISKSEETQRLPEHDDGVLTVAFSPDGYTVVSGSADKTVRIWDIAKGEQRQEVGKHVGSVLAAGFSPVGDTVATGSEDGIVRLWSVATGKLIQQLIGHGEEVYAVAFSPDNKTIASGSGDKTTRIWDVLTGKETQKLEGGSSIYAVAFSPDSKILASGSGDTTIKLSDTITQTQGQSIVGHTKEITAIALSPDGKTAASGSMDHTVSLWEMGTGRKLHKLQGHHHSISAIAFSPESTVVASGSGDNMVVLWNVATGEQMQKFEGHTGEISAISFSPDGKMVASGSDDKTVRLWDAATVAELQVHRISKSVSRIAFADDGNWLETDIGRLDLGNILSAHRRTVTNSEPTLGVHSSWIKHQGVDLIWLPHEYRASCHCASGSILVMGHTSGGVSFLSAKGRSSSVPRVVDDSMTDPDRQGLVRSVAKP